MKLRCIALAEAYLHCLRNDRVEAADKVLWQLSQLQKSLLYRSQPLVALSAALLNAHACAPIASQALPSPRKTSVAEDETPHNS